MAELGAEHTDESFLFRMRTGVPYGQSRLANDFATVRAIVMPGDKRQLRDMRRSRVVETFTGGGDARDVAEKFGNTIDTRTCCSRRTIRWIWKRFGRLMQRGSKGVVERTKAEEFSEWAAKFGKTQVWEKV